MAADNLVKSFLHRLRTQFYPDDEKGFFQSRSMLITAITLPARWLDERGVRLPEKRIEEILVGIIRGIQHHGDTGRIGYFCAYFLKCVQDHMKHHGDDYYEEGKRLRLVLDTAVENLTKKQAARLGDAQDRTTAELAALNRLVSSTAVKKRKAARPAGTQLDLFA
jgi:hypothetical protein